MLHLLEGEQLAAGLSAGGMRTSARAPEPAQFSLFAPTHPAVDRLRELHPDGITPLEALRVLDELVRLAKDV
jgi:hypothetical protein